MFHSIYRKPQFFVCLSICRSNPISHHKLSSSNSWYDNSPSSSSSRNHYSSVVGNSVVQQPDSSYDRSSGDLSDTTTIINNSSNLCNNLSSNTATTKIISSSSAGSQSQQLSNLIPVSGTSQTGTTSASTLKLLNNNSSKLLIKSRSGSESPGSSRSNSRSPCSCSSTNSNSTTTSTNKSLNDKLNSPLRRAGSGDIVISTSATSGPENNRGQTRHSSHRPHHHQHNRSTPSSHQQICSASVPSSHHISHASSHHSQHSAHLHTPPSNKQQQLNHHSRRSLTSSCETLSIQQPLQIKNNNSGTLVTGQQPLQHSNPTVHSEDNRPFAICVRNFPNRSSDTSLKDGLFHEYKKHGKVTSVKVVGQNQDRYALVYFKKQEDVEKALEVSQNKLFFCSKIEVSPYQGYDVDDNEFRPYEAELDEYHPKSTRTLFIGNLEKDIEKDELRKHFECFGEIIDIDIKKQTTSAAYAFCQYSDIVSVVRAMRKMDGEHLGNTRVKLGFGKSMPTNCVWIDGISDCVAENQLHSHFSCYGNIQTVQIDRERKLALIFYDQIGCAQTAVKEMRGVIFKGHKLQIDFASRECQEAFMHKLGKSESFEGSLRGGSSNFTESTTPTAATNNSSRYISSTRSRASSFSRPGQPISGAGSPNSTPSAGSTPRHLSTSSNSGRGRLRYLNNNTSSGDRVGGASSEYYDSGDYMETLSSSSRRYRNYDEYSQGSGASHEDLYEPPESYVSYSSNHYPTSSSRERERTGASPPPPSSIQSRLGVVVDDLPTSITSSSMRRRCDKDKSPGKPIFAIFMH